MKITQVFWLADYFYYLWRSHSRHGTHSPFVYQFADQILYQKFEPIDIDILELWRSETMQKRLNVKNVHYSSVVFPQKKYLTLLFRIFRSIPSASTVVELGQSLWSVPRIMESAKKDFQYHHFSDVHFTENLSDSESYESDLSVLYEQSPIQHLFTYLETKPRIDLIFINANITKTEPALSVQSIDQIIDCLAEQGCLCIYGLDNNWNQKDLWDQLIRHPRVTAHIDLFKMGILFVRPEQRKEKFILRY